MSRQMAEQWLAAAAASAKKKDLDAHMGLISRSVNVAGVPGFDSIGCDDWYTQCQHEFEKEVLKGVRYGGLKITAETPNSITRIAWNDC